MSLATPVIEGLIILDKYEENELAAEHDILFAGPDDTEKITAKDREQLEALGWFIHSDTDSWAHFV